MRPRHTKSNRQTESGSLPARREEGFEDARPHFWRNSGAGIAYADRQLPVTASGIEHHLPAGDAGLQGILEQIDERASKRLAVVVPIAWAGTPAALAAARMASGLEVDTR